jgi:phosphate transport system protein
MTESQERTPVFMLTLLACETARGAAAAMADALASNSRKSHEAVAEAEARLDQFDREIDDGVTDALSTTPANARELLACMKFIVDLERIGDLLVAVSSCSSALQRRIATQDMSELVRMATVLETMISHAQTALANSDLELVLAILRADAELDRIRNLTLMRHLEGAPDTAPHDSIHVVFMAQALERCGDHAKNLAETVCHLVTGKSVRHVSRSAGRSLEQMYLDFLRTQKAASPLAVAASVAARRRRG